MLGNQQSGPGGMHPQDLRNLVYFFIIAACMYFIYDALVVKPQTAALRQQRAAQMQAVKAQEAEAEKPPRTRSEIIADSPRITIDNGKIKGTLSLRGARIDDIALTEYFTTIEKKEHVVLLSPKDTDFARQVAHGWVAENNVKVPGEDSLWQAEGNASLSPGNSVTISWNNGQGLTFRNTYSIDEEYVISLRQSVTNNSGADVTLHPYGLVSQAGMHLEHNPTWIVHEGPIGFSGDELHQTSYAKLRKEAMEFSGAGGWAGITDKYWLTALIPAQDAETRYNYRHSGLLPTKKGQKDKSKYQVDYTGAAVTVAPGQTAGSESHIYAGAKKVLTLEEYADKLNVPKLDLAVDFGWFWFMTKPFFFALHFLALHSNIAIAMVLLTVLIRFAVFPLTNVSYKSFAKMKKVTPQVSELRKVYGHDKAKLQEELVKLYQQEGVNPMSGCFPMLIQIPIFFSLYKVLVTTIEMRQAPFYGWIHDMSEPDPTNIFTLFGIIDWSPPAILHIGAWPCMMLVLLMFQKQLNPPPQDPIQRDMALYFPFIMTYLMAKFASGLVIYWTISALIGIIQQTLIMRSQGVPIYLFGGYKGEKKLEQQIKEGPSVHPLIEMAEKDVEEALFGDDDDNKDGAPKTTVSPPKRGKKKKK